MTRDHLLLGSVSSFVLALGCLFGSPHLGAAGGVVATLGVGLFILSMVGLVAYRVARLIGAFRRQ